MEIAEIILEYVKALVWPIVAVIALFLHKSTIATLFLRLKGADLPGGVSLDFDEEVKKAEVISDNLSKEPPRKPPNSPAMLPITKANARMLSLGLQPSPSGLDMSKYTELASQDPNLALAGLRIEVEILARNLAKGFKIEARPNESISALLRRLHEGAAITEQQFQLARKITQLCNAAVHGTRVSREDAESVIDVAQVLTRDYLAWLSWGFGDDWDAN